MAFIRTTCIRCFIQKAGSSRHTLKAHIWQINEMIADEGYRIEGRGSFYRLVSIPRMIHSTSSTARRKCDPCKTPPG